MVSNIRDGFFSRVSRIYLQSLSSLFTSITLVYRGKSLSASALIYLSNIIMLLLLPPSLRSLPLENYILVDLKFSSYELIGY